MRVWRIFFIVVILTCPLRTASGQSGQPAQDWVLGPGYEGFVEVGAASDFKVLEEIPKTIQLKKGEVFAVVEAEAPGRTVKIITPQTQVILHNGGVIVEAVEKGTWVRVIGNQAKVGTQSVDEGFSYFVATGAKKGVTKRLQYHDYARWQPWVKKWYQKKDDHDRDYYAESIH